MADQSSGQTSAVSVDDRKLVKSVVYLASLASESKEIDPKLDILRKITAGWNPQMPLGPSNVATLQKLISDLKDYLVNRDPLRSFTSEALDERLTSEIEGNRRKLLPFAVMLAACVAVGVIAAVVPLPISRLNQNYLSVTSILLSTNAVTIWLYLSSLSNFKPELQRVFIYLGAGAVSIGLACLHYLLIGLFQVTDLPLFKYGGATEIALIGVALIYFGLRKYAGILGIDMKKISSLLNIGLVISVGLTAVVAFLRGVPDKLFFGLSLESITATLVFAVAGQMFVKRILESVTASYAKSLKIFRIFQVAVSVVAVAFIIALVWFGQLSVGTLSLLIGVAAIPTIALFMYSGYSFKKETSR